MIAIPEVGLDAVMANIGFSLFVGWSLFYFKVMKEGYKYLKATKKVFE